MIKWGNAVWTIRGERGRLIQLVPDRVVQINLAQIAVPTPGGAKWSKIQGLMGEGEQPRAQVRCCVGCSRENPYKENSLKYLQARQPLGRRICLHVVFNVFSNLMFVILGFLESGIHRALIRSHFPHWEIWDTHGLEWSGKALPIMAAVNSLYSTPMH